jgi:spermidine/putrescine transport system substrate-binding protein
MSDKYTDPALLRGLTQRRIGRRGLLSAATASAAALGLAACGVKGKAKGTASAAPDAVAKYWAGKTSTGHVNFANWPLYMDPKKPELAQFTKDTGVTVTYKEVINDLASWFAKVQPQLSAGQSIGYDIMVITNGSQFKDFVQLGLFAPLDHSKLPNYAANAAPKYKEEAFDKGNVYSIPWQSGITGIAYNPKYVKTPPTSLNDLRNPAYKGKVGMFSDVEEIGNFGMMAVGVAPEQSTPDDWHKAANWLTQQRDAGIVRKYYDQDYAGALASGDIWITQAWSGDIYQQNLSNPGANLKFVIPSEGGTLWTDNMTIPITAENAFDAIKLMDFFYKPDIAGSLAEYINYITPVPAAKQKIEQDAAAATGEDKKALEDLATSPLVFPQDSDYAKLHYYRDFVSSAEQHEYNSIFDPIVTS